MKTFDAMINYSQFNIFRDGAVAGNDWTGEHMAQGFSWRDDCAAFGLPQGVEWVRVEVATSDVMPPLPDETLLRIVVPWSVDNDDATSFSNPVKATPLGLPAGRYALVYDLMPGFEEGEEDYEGRIVLTFARSDDASFAIVRQHPDNPSADVLARTANPA